MDVLGVGYAMVVVNLICTMYYNVILGYSLIFVAESFRSKLPWIDCDNYWNTPNCSKLAQLGETSKNIRFRTTPADEFFQ